MEDLITVVVPIYNREKYLHETMESILNQTYKNLEIILVDDGSTDNSLSILKYYERLDKRVKVITQKNMGICMAMKNALSISNGEYIARCDSDDINELDRYEKQLKYLKENNYDAIGLYLKSFGNGNENAKKGMEIFNNKPILNSFDQENRINTGSNIGGGGFFSKACVLKKFNPFHKDYGLVEDVYLYITLHKNGCKIGILEEVLYNYRVHHTNTSLSTGNRKNVVSKYFEALFRFLFNEKLEEYKSVVIIKREDEEKLIKDTFKNYFNHLNIKFVNEYSFENFVQNEIFNYRSEDTIFFAGNMFFKCVLDILKYRNYKMYENLFLLVDCYY